jgi:pyridoxamine 5'-phosphate oxidase
VLLKEIDDRGFTFYTNYGSRKAADLAAHPHAALGMFWEPMHRQIRVEGEIEKVTAAESDAYFAVRPRDSQIGSIASPQSQPIASRAALEERVAKVMAAHGEGIPPRPASWGGYRVLRR